MNGGERLAIVPDNWPETAAWLERARSDRRAAELCVAADPPLFDVASFHCQQATEKLLKGFLVLAGQPVPRTHDLISLSDRVAALFPEVSDLARATEAWTVWSTAYRYPSEDTAVRLRIKQIQLVS
jgi:HEPN domain-containing protein